VTAACPLYPNGAAHPHIAPLVSRHHRIAFGWIGATTAFGVVVRKP
jgi:hypothetical protein